MEKNLEAINALSFSDFEGLQMGEALSIPYYNEEFIPPSIKHTVGRAIRFFRGVFAPDLELTAEINDAKILFLYTGNFFRKDYLQLYLKVASCCEEKDMIYPSGKKRKIAFAEKLSGLRLALGDIKKIRSARTTLSLDMILYLSLHILKVRRCFLFLGRYNLTKYQAVVVFDDSSPCEHLIIEKLKQSKPSMVTTTMQHGAFGGKRGEKPQTLDEKGLEFSLSNSDYFMAWNKDTIDKAVYSGMKEKKLVIVGIPQFIGYSQRQIPSDNKDVFGVVLNGSMFEDHNVALITLANQISEQIKMRYILKYHPAYRGDEYALLVDDNHCEGNYAGDGIVEYASKVKFSIITCSGVLNELLYLGSPVYRYHYAEDKFSYIKQNSFHSLKEFLEIYPNDEGEALFDRLCTVRNVKHAYTEFFSNLCVVQ